MRTPGHQAESGPRSAGGRRGAKRPARSRRSAVAAGSLLLGLWLVGLAGCADQDDCVCCPADREAPAAPRGLYSITGNGAVTLVWLANTESDLASYRVYTSDYYAGVYHFLARVPACGDCYRVEYVDLGAVNGETYFYAVAALDHAGNESALSVEYVWDTPRPDGRAVVANALRQGGYDWAAFDFQGRRAVAADDPRADFFFTFDSFAGGFLIAGRDRQPADPTAIQDMGYTADFDEIDYAPARTDGWSPTGTAEPILGHTYVLLTRENHYAKIRITGLNADEMAFEWAFQLVPFNRQLKRPAVE